MAVTVITSKDQFDQIVDNEQSKKLIVIGFVNGSNDCQFFSTDVLGKVAKYFTEDVRTTNLEFYQVNIHEGADGASIARERGVDTTPVCHFYKEGELIDGTSGAIGNPISETIYRIHEFPIRDKARPNHDIYQRAQQYYGPGTGYY
ncbi:Thioredoxin H-type [Wickerhamomyces ciferrii]|uniref:Thioredoxin H-type n=1 Tax=Wickerhamomyces ciferrii (strain ATCC 14091 / BCRC 22168 / CBS 111 / JCM 3599 / NBRC 0793 / NRRL Y-1031 F-60-10) TaxID=1206466 RepID=K0KGD2_WICCF|nr:Thioredoxin H-type [Wickerhamomyces ciferrii]CCH44220.1 Thioredoxin H-type [Wickerhamomyces ciferrii]